MYFITFLRKMGAKGTEIAKLVAKELQYKFYDTEAIECTAREMGFLDDIREVDGKAPSFLKRLFSLRPEIFLERLYAVIYEMASRGSAVFLGRGGNMLFRPIPCALHVRVIASRETRMRNLARKALRMNMPLSQWKKVIARGKALSDSPSAGFGIIRSFTIWCSIRITSQLMSLSTRHKYSPTEEIRNRSADVKDSLRMMGLAAKVEAALSDRGLPPKTFPPPLQVPVRSG